MDPGNIPKSQSPVQTKEVRVLGTRENHTLKATVGRRRAGNCWCIQQHRVLSALHGQCASVEVDKAEGKTDAQTFEVKALPDMQSMRSEA